MTQNVPNNPSFDWTTLTPRSMSKLEQTSSGNTTGIDLFGVFSVTWTGNLKGTKRERTSQCLGNISFSWLYWWQWWWILAREPTCCFCRRFCTGRILGWVRRVSILQLFCWSNSCSHAATRRIAMLDDLNECKIIINYYCLSNLNFWNFYLLDTSSYSRGAYSKWR